jgi:nucleosome assembly protein 1-like 1
MITDRDEVALKDLTDVRMEYLDKPGFKLIFEFAENEFFTNKIITKTYFYQNESGYGGDFIYDHAEGDKIDWKPSKDLTVRIESKKQRNKSKSLSSILDIADQLSSRYQTNPNCEENRPHRIVFQLFLAP